MNNSRALVVIFVIFAFFCALAFRLFSIQIKKHEDYDYYAKNQQVEKRIIRAERGFIYDRNGELLAYDRNDVSFYVDVKMPKGKQIDSIAVRFASIFGKSKNYYKNLIRNSSTRIVCLEKKVPADKAIKLKDYKIDGLFSKEDPTRVYSYDNLASHILGYVNNEYHGTEGVEKYYNKLLTGTDGTLIVQKDVRGRMITVSEDATIQPVPGNNLVLTIDKSYQKILEEELRLGLQQFQSNSAVGIIMDPNNGEILALANMPDFNPNFYWNYKDEIRRNRAVTDTYEPGSTFKSVTISTLIDQKLVKLDESVYAENGKYKYKRANITDSHRHQFLTVRGIIEQSSNIGMAKIIGRLDDDKFYKYLRNFGFGNFTSIDLPGESKGKLKKPESFNELTQAFMSFGYEVSVTPLQIISSYAALVNGGKLFQPHLLKKITDRNCETKEEVAPKMLRNVISDKTSAKLRDLLVGVVENGTGDKAKIENVKVGGKTGTSQQLINNKYSSSSHNSSFVGFFPADNPKVLIYVLVSAPKVGQYGGVVAGPIFKNIAERLLQTDINLLSNSKGQYKSKTSDTFKDVFTSNNIKQLKNQKKPDNSVKKEEKENSYANIPETVINNPKSRKLIVNKHIMPDLTNNYLRDAVTLLTEMGIKSKVSGSGKVVSQSITPGQAVKPGLVCTLKCEERKISGARIN
ncbi:MAG: penicillin-binding protein [Clostridiales bacterium]